MMRCECNFFFELDFRLWYYTVIYSTIFILWAWNYLLDRKSFAFPHLNKFSPNQSILFSILPNRSANDIRRCRAIAGCKNGNNITYLLDSDAKNKIKLHPFGMHASLHLALVPKGCNFIAPLELIFAAPRSAPNDVNTFFRIRLYNMGVKLLNS